MGNVSITVSSYKDRVKYRLDICDVNGDKDSINIFDRGTLRLILTTLGEDRIREEFFQKGEVKNEKDID